MNNLGDEFSRWGGVFLGWIPHLVSAIIAFVIGWIIALILKSIITGVLKALGLNRKIERSRAEGAIHKLTLDPSASIGSFVYWLAMIVTILVSVEYLQIPVLTDFVTRIYNYIPNIIGAILILLVALAISASLSAIILRWMGETITGKVVSGTIPVVILSIAGFAILEQLKVAPIIISTTYIALIGSVSLASALAFGIGGRDVAARLLESGYEKGARNIDRIRSDVARGAENAKRDAENIRRRTEK